MFAEVQIGAKVPDFQGQDLKGSSHRITDYLGKIVVLEWSSPECPYSRRYYESGTLDSLYDFALQNNIIWINIVPRLQKLKSEHALEHLDLSKKIVIVDNEFDISTLFGASTTPQIFIVDRQGTLAYTGAIDSTATFKKSIRKVVPYTRNALNDLLANREVGKKITRAFGCYVKNNVLTPIQEADSLAPITPIGSKESGSQ